MRTYEEADAAILAILDGLIQDYPEHREALEKIRREMFPDLE